MLVAVDNHSALSVLTFEPTKLKKYLRVCLFLLVKFYLIVRDLFLQVGNIEVLVQRVDFTSLQVSCFPW